MAKNNHPNRSKNFSIPVSHKLITDLLSHFGPDPVTRGWCCEADTTAHNAYVIEEDDNGRKRKFLLDADARQKGLLNMAKEYPHHVGKVLDEGQHDAPLADLFVQCCLFGEEKYA